MAGPGKSLTGDHIGSPVVTQTTAGTTYTTYLADPGAAGQPALIQRPAAATQTSPLVIVGHGVDGSHRQTLLSTWTGVREAMLDAGYTVATSYAHGPAWGNDASQADVQAMRGWVADTFGWSGPVVIVGQSMGGALGQLLAANKSIPDLRGFAGISAVCDLEAMHANGYAGSINAAYGVASYAAVPAGHDPIDRAPADYSGLRLRWYASDGDTITPKAAHADAMATHVAATATEAQVVACTGGHVSTDHYRPADLLGFLARCFA